MSNVVRRLVSKKKKRFEYGGYDLDLSYITDRIIAMGYPSERIESLYRNKMSDVEHFLDELHGDAYKVYNLCSERKYSHDHFGGRIAEFPFNDHQAPDFNLVINFCLDVVCFVAAGLFLFTFTTGRVVRPIPKQRHRRALQGRQGAHRDPHLRLPDLVRRLPVCRRGNVQVWRPENPGRKGRDNPVPAALCKVL